jgi:hypothetical protein
MSEASWVIRHIIEEEHLNNKSKGKQKHEY